MTAKNQEHATKRPAVQTNKNSHNCGRYGHFAHDCCRAKTESAGQTPARSKPSTTKQITSNPAPVSQELMDLLFFSSDEEEAEVRMVRVRDKGSQACCGPVQIQGVPMYGIIDSGADITIIGGSEETSSTRWLLLPD